MYMRKATFRLMLIALPMLLGLVSCAEHDNPINMASLKGLYWGVSDEKGTLPDYFELTEYDRMGMAYQFIEDGTGYGFIFFFTKNTHRNTMCFHQFMEFSLMNFSTISRFM